MFDPSVPGMRKRRRAFNDPGHAHELTFCCHRRLPFLAKDRARRWVLESIAAACRKWDFELWAYVIMPEHVHLLVFPKRDSYSVSDLLKAIKQPVARRAINHLKVNAPAWLDELKVTWPNGRVEHRFWEQGGGYDRNICTPKAAWGSVEYLHLNPVRRGLVGCATDWAWSSARCYAGMAGVELPVDDRPPDPA